MDGITPPPLNGKQSKKNNSKIPWWAGCLIALGAGFFILPIIGILAAIAIPNFIRARDTSQMNACVANMKIIQATKEQLTLQNEEISKERIDNSIGREMTCPAGGTYRYNARGEEPSCSIHGRPSAPTTLRDIQRQRLQR